MLSMVLISCPSGQITARRYKFDQYPEKSNCFGYPA
jgi:hypothetical protein